MKETLLYIMLQVDNVIYPNALNYLAYGAGDTIEFLSKNKASDLNIQNNNGGIFI